MATDQTKTDFYLSLSQEQFEFRIPHSYYNSQKSGLVSTRLEEVGNMRICADLIIILHLNLAAIQITKSSQKYWSANKLTGFLST